MENDTQFVMVNQPHKLFEWLGIMLPGLMLAAGLAFGGNLLSHWFGTSVLSFRRSPVSAILVAIVLGLVIRNTIGVPSVYKRGLGLCVQRVLRIGIVLLGLRFSLMAAGQIGLVGLPIVVVCIGSALLIVTWFNRVLGLPPRLGTLIAAGTSICGVTAIVATSPVIDAEEDEMSYAVACITIFGLVALFTYPFLSHWMFDGDAHRAGLFLGTAIHETAQVAGAGMIYQEQYSAPEALDTATVTKLVRNVCMVAVIPIMAFAYRRRSADTSKSSATKWYQLVPLFVVAFVMMAVVRSVGDRFFGTQGVHAWQQFLVQSNHAAKWCLSIAMAAVGLGTGLSSLKALGWKPFCVGFVAAALVGGVSVSLVTLLGPLL